MTETLTALPVAGPEVAPPPPEGDRWRPTRAGLISMWRYWEETFTFHRGRLLLRGPNGSGKSMALELLLPFLLEADASPEKLTSAARSRGTLFDRVMTGSDEPTRTGFAWVEFARGHQVFTVGARIRASQATRRVDLDFFTTNLAVGGELHLLDDNRTPLSRRALIEAIGDSGRVHGSAEEHRAALRETLYSDFNADRYLSVIGALRALRKEKLSQNLDVDKLSSVLSDALPPIDEHDIAAVAEGFERLDRRKAELAALESDVNHVRQLAARQRDYAVAVVLAAAGDVRSTETRRDDVTRDERRAREELAAAITDAQAAATERETLAARDESIGIEIEGLKDSEAYKQGAALADLRRQATRLREVADRDRMAAQTRSEEHATAVHDQETAAENLQTASANEEAAARDLRFAGQETGAEGPVVEAVGTQDLDDAERLVRAWINARAALIGEVRLALGRHEQAVTERGIQETRVADDESTVEERRAAHADAVTRTAVAVAVYRQSVETWADACEIIGPARTSGVLPQPPDVPAAVTDAVAALAAELRAEDRVARRDLAAQREALVGERAAVEAERTRWAGAGFPQPEGPPWRSDRADRPGAPLWALVDPLPGLAGSDVDLLEAALAGAGLLDAWLEPDGAVDLGPDRADVVLTVRLSGADTLASLVGPAAPVGRAEGPMAVPADVVAAVLASIPVVDSALSPFGPGADPGPDVAVGRDGTFRLGAALGRGPLRPASLLGAPARERHRLARLAELDSAMAAIDDRLDDLRRQEGALDQWWAAVTSELSTLPSPAPVDEAELAASHAAARLGEARSHRDASRAALKESEGKVRGALRDLTLIGARHGVPTDAQELVRVEAGLSRLQDAVVTWARRRRELRRAEQDHVTAADRAARAEREAARAVEALESSERDARAVAGRVKTLESSLGAGYAEVLSRISGLDEERAGGRSRQRELAQGIPRLERRVGELDKTVETAAVERARAEEDRERAHRQFVAAVDDLGQDAEMRPDTRLDSGTALLAFARSVAAAHPEASTDPATVERLSERVRERVHQAQAALGPRVDVDRQYVDAGWWVLRTSAGGVRRQTGDLADSLTGLLEQGRAELAAEEEQLFEQTLAGSVRRALADRIRQANKLVDGINAQLAAVRTQAGGVQVRLRWDVDPDQLAAVKAAQALLLRDPIDLSDVDRDSLQAFVRARVDQARVELEANAPWEARLRETLDYRAWHRFTLQLGHRDWQGFEPATPRRLQRLSTGERSIALHLPMIASVAAHYTGPEGRPLDCPRLILLDELFAGVDTANRAQLFGTFTTWDLDAVFTSDSEWCKYPSLDGIAIHHLHPPTGTDPVTSTRFTWDGRVQRVDPAER
jgi:uncharacterized protein (TIGR02680 family)